MKENNAQINEPIDINHAKKKKSKANKPINSVPNLSNKRQLNQRQLKAKVKLLNHLESIFSILLATLLILYSILMVYSVKSTQIEKIPTTKNDEKD